MASSGGAGRGESHFEKARRKLDMTGPRPRYGITEIIIVIAILGIVLSVALQLVVRAKCKNGGNVPTGRTVCETYGTQTVCEPETRFVCND